MSDIQKVNILMMIDSNPVMDPRPNRMIELLRYDFNLTVVARNTIDLDNVESIQLTEPERSGAPSGLFFLFEVLRKFYLKVIRLFVRVFRLMFKDYDGIVRSSLQNSSDLIDNLRNRNFDLIISHDLTLLPFAFSAKGENSKIILDAHEYYPRNFEDQWYWRFKTQPVNIYLCNKYLAQCDKILTVSDGLAEEYRREFNVDPEVIMSLPPYFDLHPFPADEKKIRMIHHGAASRSRRLELMIDMMAHLDDRYTLDLMLVGDLKYIKELSDMAKKTDNVRLIPPVPMKQIVPFINHYDIGVFLCPPSNFNLKFTLPNKLFEFIQGRLAVAIGPSIEMKKIVEQYNCGVVSESFEPGELASRIKGLSIENINFYKHQSGLASYELSAKASGDKMREIIGEVLHSS